jgi:Uncharacterized protein conserved in bacteria (DUF2155)
MVWLRVLSVVLAVFLVASCSKEKSQPYNSADSDKESEAIPYAQPPQMGGADTPAISGNAPVVSSEAIKAKWKAVKLLVEDKKGKTSNDFTVDFGGKIDVPDTGLSIEVLDFLPDLKIDGNTFTTASNELLNPAAHVRVTENGKEVFNGWLFQLFPSVHPFRHDRYNIVLQEPIPVS